MLDLILWSLLALASLFSAGHALLHKRDPRAALGWIVLCLFAPGFGAAIYWLLGVNRIRTLARDWQIRGEGMHWPEAPSCAWGEEMAGTLPFRAENFAALLSLSDAVTRRPLLEGNRLHPLHNGEEAYPPMLQAIDDACTSILLSTYIFDSDSSGERFVRALAAAADRGVDVRVLVDALGERYSWPPVHRRLRASAVRVVRFLPPSLSGRGIHLNLRNHRKLLVIDDRVGFTGGMNIGDRHLAASANPRRVIDLHFRVEGPVVGEMREAFLEDWHFATGETFESLPYPPAAPGGRGYCRGISAGPNEDFEKLTWLVVGALGCARRRIRIMTPYFIPDRSLIAAINTAALRGVEVEILLPGRNNLPYVDWASRAYLWELLQYGTRISHQGTPFVHSKLLLIDDEYALVGSANLDPRSLRLNFEFNLEVYDHSLVEQLSKHFDQARSAATPATLASVDARPLPVKIRDAAAKLFSPYL